MDELFQYEDTNKEIIKIKRIEISTNPEIEQWQLFNFGTNKWEKVPHNRLIKHYQNNLVYSKRVLIEKNEFTKDVKI